MDPKEVAELIKDRYPTEVRDIKEYRDQVSVIVNKGRIKEILRFLHDAPELNFDHLADLCGVDYLGRKEPRFEVVYQLLSIRHKHRIRIRAEVPENDCAIDSVVDIWKGANWPERECYDLMGVVFKGHPELRRVLLPEDWEGHPLRKDYPAKSDLGEREWHGYTEVKEISKRNKQYEVG